MDNQINSIALKYALMFSEKENIPARFKMSKVGKLKYNRQSPVEIRFQEYINSWISLFKVLLSKVETEQACRFILLTPKIETSIKSVAFCQDFIDFTDFFILRRDLEECSGSECGLLSTLHTAFQRSIENKLLT